MPKLKPDDFHPEVLKLFDQFVHGAIDRRGFLSSATKYAVSGVSAGMLLEALSPCFAEAQQIAPSDKRIKAHYVEYSSPLGYGKGRGYLAELKAAAEKRPGVLVIHENRGLNPHIEDIARRIALENFIAFAPDALTPLGGYPGDEDRARELFAKLDQNKTQQDFIAAAKFLQALPECNGKLGVIGFCWGGGMANTLATQLPELAAVVPFYGPQPPVADVAKIKAALLLHYAQNDDRINAGWPAYEAALKAAGVRYSVYQYPHTQHGFNNDTTPRYDETAAKLAWQRSMDFFKANLAS